MGMETFDAGDDLVVEVHLSDPPLVKVRSRDMERDGEAQGTVIVWPAELQGLVTALCSAAAALAEYAASSGTVAESTL